ncbi:hypothetical protein J2W97_000817 [Paenibacillus jamilae]|jgi:hypothetical protein|uniref:hypothetical protein n=1 Tax=Paenibacillus polymyxa TaxID=1406 RepID=UPI00042EBE30|nr:hypothetical protein [Paenibacillus polymyxa]MDP9674834.1 hypothetical protein [Paenibacillus jamilae]AHM66909.1 hypothetical protein PPSQR21_032700 [Paenibacillus polymyxa SQR-21]MBY0023797.1 hypothetical protein [Paenibacillus polymyxa]MBY0056469.1 hypothetical protein [Paenibacillus polymyxa]MBY0071816.1 hypothetical protein [Paenibacillus polymyxa]
MRNVWLIAGKNDGKQPIAYRVTEQDAEGYTNALRGRGYVRITVARPTLEIDDVAGTVNYPEGGE